MPSIKQIEAFYWCGTLGSFVAAARRLNTTQSNISKRIQELESTLGFPIFDRSRRSIRLTPNGQTLMNVGESLLRTHEEIISLGSRASRETGTFAFGATEAVAVTWLPAFLAAVRKRFPKLSPIAQISDPQRLNKMLRERRIDFMIVPRRHVFVDAEVVELQTLERIWLASPALVTQSALLSTRDVASLPILSHSDSKPIDLLIARHLRKDGLAAAVIARCSSLTTLARMAGAGMGLTFMYKGIFDEEICSGRLRVVECAIPLPSSPYVASYRNDPSAALSSEIAALAKLTCDFSTTHLRLPHEPRLSLKLGSGPINFA